MIVGTYLRPELFRVGVDVGDFLGAFAERFRGNSKGIRQRADDLKARRPLLPREVLGKLRLLYARTLLQRGLCQAGRGEQRAESLGELFAVQREIQFVSGCGQKKNGLSGKTITLGIDRLPYP